MSMIRWNTAALLGLMDRDGIPTRRQLAIRARISVPTASALFDGKRLGRLDVVVLEALATLFRVHPWDLLEYVPDE